MAPPVKINPGDVFARLTVIERIAVPGNPRYLCRCTCGTETEVYGGNLRTGKVKSCGCLRRENAERRRRDVVYQNGYAFVKAPGHPRASKYNGRVREHILVMEKHLGRYLLPDEEVHHKNSDRADNRLENLELWTRSHPAGGRVSDKIAWAISMLETYEPERLKSTTP